MLLGNIKDLMLFPFFSPDDNGGTDPEEKETELKAEIIDDKSLEDKIKEEAKEQNITNLDDKKMQQLIEIVRLQVQKSDESGKTVMERINNLEKKIDQYINQALTASAKKEPEIQDKQEPGPEVNKSLGQDKSGSGWKPHYKN